MNAAPRVRAYLIAVAVTAAAVMATLPLQQTLDRFPYLPLLVAAVIVSTWTGGLGPGLVTVAGGAVAAEYLVRGDLHAVGAQPKLLLQLTLFVAVAAVVTAVWGSRIRMAAARRDRLMWELEERVKELTLLHRATSLLDDQRPIEPLLRELVGVLPAGWQFPELLESRITVADAVVASPGFQVTAWIQRAEFPVHGGSPGVLEVVYRDAPPVSDGPFLPEEAELIESLANLLGGYFDRRHRIEERLELIRAQASRTEAEAASRMKDTFLATVSHELRRPLTAILGWTRMLRDTHPTDTARGLEVIERNANIQLRLIEELMDEARTSAGELKVTCALVNLNAILRNVADAAGPAAVDRHLDITTNFTGERTPVRGDGIRLQQMFGNLVGNALKFTPAGGRITVTLKCADRHAEIVVADTGIGIEPRLLPRVFDRFWQADGSTASSREGLGLGLSIVRRLAELHGGTIDAHSDGPGTGTRMIVRLPLASEDDDPTSDEQVRARQRRRHCLPPALRGRHLGEILIKAGLETARHEGLRVVPVCPFVKAFLRTHPDDST